jgi:hypothetical protein
MLKVEFNSKRVSRSDQKRPTADLLVSGELFPDEMMRGLIDDCLVPLLIDRFLRNPKAQHSTRGDADNRGSP